MRGTTDVTLMTISRTNPTSQPARTEARTNASKTAPFSRENPYNRSTTRRPLICQFAENVRFVSSIVIRLYKNHKICERIQRTSPVGYWLSGTFSGVKAAVGKTKKIVAATMILYKFSLTGRWLIWYKLE